MIQAGADIDMQTLQPPTLDEIEHARDNIHGLAIRTPLVRLNIADAPAEIFLKLENLQPTGAFKVRCQGNVVKSATTEVLEPGVFTGSSGNSGTALAWVARHFGIPARVYTPQGAPQNKLEAIKALGAKVHVLPYEDWWNVLMQGRYPGENGFFANAVNSQAALAGNATIGLEILEDLPDVDTVVVPFGGGGVSCGIASAIRALKPSAKVLAAESEAALPLAAALKAGGPVPVSHGDSFISGVGAETVLPVMWPLIKELIDGAVSSTLDEVAATIRLLFESNRVVAEGAGAVAPAAALSGKAGHGKIVCVVSGGNIDAHHMIDVLSGKRPGLSLPID